MTHILTSAYNLSAKSIRAEQEVIWIAKWAVTISMKEAFCVFCLFVTFVPPRLQTVPMRRSFSSAVGSGVFRHPSLTYSCADNWRSADKHIQRAAVDCAWTRTCATPGSYIGSGRRRCFCSSSGPGSWDREPGRWWNPAETEKYNLRWEQSAVNNRRLLTVDSELIHVWLNTGGKNNNKVCCWRYSAPAGSPPQAGRDWKWQMWFCGSVFCPEGLGRPCVQ